LGKLVNGGKTATDAGIAANEAAAHVDARVILERLGGHRGALLDLEAQLSGSLCQLLDEQAREDLLGHSSLDFACRLAQRGQPLVELTMRLDYLVPGGQQFLKLFDPDGAGFDVALARRVDALVEADCDCQHDAGAAGVHRPGLRAASGV
jgi:hypothetical protein